MKFKVELTGGKEISDLLKRAPKEKEAEIRAEVGRTALDIRTSAMGYVRSKGIHDTGFLGNDSILAEFSSTTIEAEVGSTAKYAPYVEFGTRPHWPPPEPLEAWARKRGIEVFLVQKAIAEHGMPARSFLIPAWDDNNEKLLTRIKIALEKEWK